MTSQLNVDTIANKAGSGTVAFTKQEGVKARLNYNDNSANILGSFNVSSINDEAAGKFKASWTNSFDNDDYSTTGNHAEDNGLYSNFGAGSRISWFNSSRSSSVCYGATEVVGSGFTDMRTVEGQFIGDLA
tara:strand:+ start:140 stop:532 length:393 start_codon:yes stop_codon:yes gene_type:complete